MTTVRQRSILLCSLALVLPFALVNVVVVPLGYRVGPVDPGGVWVFVCMGAIGAEAALHAIWCVLAPVGFAKRLAIGAGVGLVLFGAWAVGYAVAVSEYGGLDEYYWGYVVTALLSLPLLAIAIQSPLWLARLWLGWSVAQPGEPFRKSHAEAFRIRDLLVATGAVAAALSAARLAVPDDVSYSDRFFVGLVIGALVAAGISLLTTLPVVVATLRASRTRVALLALLGMLPLAVTITIGFTATWAAIAGSRAPTWAYVGLASMAASYLVCLAAVMLVVRGLGYRLVWGRRRAVLARPPDRSD